MNVVQSSMQVAPSCVKEPIWLFWCVDWRAAGRVWCNKEVNKTSGREKTTWAVAGDVGRIHLWFESIPRVGPLRPVHSSEAAHVRPPDRPNASIFRFVCDNFSAVNSPVPSWSCGGPACGTTVFRTYSPANIRCVVVWPPTLPSDVSRPFLLCNLQQKGQWT